MAHTKLVALKRRLGMNQDHLAAKAGVSPGTIRQLEHGLPACPRPEALQKLAEAPQVATADLGPAAGPAVPSVPTRAEKVRTHRLALGMSRSQLAAAAGLSPQTVARLEWKRPHSFRFSTLERVATALGLSAADLALPVEESATRRVSPSLGARVVVRRKQLKLSQERLAAQAGLAWHTVSAIERGRANSVRINTLEKLAQALQLTVEDLLGDGELAAPAEEPRPQFPPGASFGARLAAYRRAGGLSQADLATRAGVTLFTICRLENGRSRYPYPATLRKLAHALQLSVSELTGDAGGEASWRDAPTLKERVAARRRQLGWTQQEFAQQTGLPLGSLHAIERGRYKPPDVATLHKIARGLQTSTAELLAGLSLHPSLEGGLAQPGGGLAARRRELGLSQSALAAQAGVSPATISLWESGKIHHPSARVLRNVARALQTSREEVCQWLGRPPFPPEATAGVFLSEAMPE